jgi:hypothetical protein
MTTQWTEATTNRHSSLEAAQRSSLQALGGAIARAVRAGLESGRFVVVDGVVRLAESSTICSPTPAQEGERDALSTSPGQ